MFVTLKRFCINFPFFFCFAALYFLDINSEIKIVFVMVVKMFEYFYEEVRFEIFCKGVSVLWGKIVSIDLVFEGNFLSVDLVFERIVSMYYLNEIF